MEREAKTPTRIAAERAAEGLRLQLQGVEEEIDHILQRPHCLIYLVGFCVGVSEATEQQQNQGEVDAMRVMEGGIIWALAGQDMEDYDRGNRIAIDADGEFVRMQAGNAPELQQVYQLAVSEGQTFVTGEARPEWLYIFVRDAVRMDET